MTTGRTFKLLAATAVLLTLVAVWAYQHMGKQRASAMRAERDLADCRLMADQIRQCRESPMLATEAERGSSETGTLIQKAVQAAGIVVGDSLGRITPQTARRVGDSAYKEQPTEVQLRKVTLKQVVAFLHSVLTSGGGLRAKSIHLSVPRDEEIGDRWTTELVLSYLIYEPQQAGE